MILDEELKEMEIYQNNSSAMHSYYTFHKTEDF